MFHSVLVYDIGLIQGTLSHVRVLVAMRRVNSITLSPFGADVVKPLLTSFTEKEVKKYRQWFSLLDSNNTGSVDIGELSSVLLSTEILSSQQQVKQFFSAADCDNSGGITFDEFLSAIDNHVRAKKIKIQKLNDVVKSKAILSKETLLSQERRTVLMKHIVDNSLTRARQLDAAFESAPACGPGQRKLKKQLSLKSMIAKNEIELEESSECLRDIGHLVSQAWQDMRKLASPHNVHCSELSQYGVLPSVESVLSSAALDLVNQKHWKHYSISNKSDTEVSSYFSNSYL